MAQTPSGATASHRPTFTWSAVPGAEVYTVVLTPINDPSAAQVLGTSTTNSLTPTADIPDGDYQWLVATSNPRCQPGSSSNPKSFTIPGTCPLSAPTLVNPPDASAVSNPVPFSWSSVPGASLYSLLVIDGVTGLVALQDTLRTTSDTATFPRGTYYIWGVSGWNSTCGSGPMSTPNTVAIP